MKNTIHYILFLLVFTASLVPASTQTTITLEEILEEVKQQSSVVQSAAYQKKLATQSNRFYKSLLKPNVALVANLPNFSKTSSPVIQPDGSLAFQSIRQANSSVGLYAEQVISKTGGTLFLNTSLQRFDDFDSDYKQFNGIPVRLGFRQSIFGFNPWKFDNKIEPLLLHEAEKTFNIKVEEALGQATSLYFDILIAKQNLDIAKTNEEVNQHLLTITEERLELGKVSKDEKLQLEIELNGSKLAVSQANNELDLAIATLHTFLGKKTSSAKDIYEEPALLVASIDIDQLLSSYRQNKPELVAYQRSLLESQKDLARAKNDYGFQANIQASIGLAKGAEQVEAIYQNPFEEQQFNLSLQIPILDWGRKDATIKQIQIQQEDLMNNYDQQILELENDIHQMVAVFTRLQKDILLFKEIMTKADERFTISNERYILGNIDITNLTLAQREKDQAKRNYINALKSYWGSYFELRRLTGFDVLKN